MALEHTVPSGRRLPDWPVAAVAGLAGGAVVMLLDLFWSVVIQDQSPWKMSYMIAAIPMGPDVLNVPGYTFDFGIVAVSLIAHYILGILFGLVLAWIMTRMRLDATFTRALIAGAVFGLCLHLFNFYGMVRFFPWFEQLRSGATFFADIVFGIVAALLYWKLERPDRAH